MWAGVSLAVEWRMGMRYLSKWAVCIFKLCNLSHYMVAEESRREIERGPGTVVECPANMFKSEYEVFSCCCCRVLSCCHLPYITSPLISFCRVSTHRRTTSLQIQHVIVSPRNLELSSLTSNANILTSIHS